jgi:predicted nucleic acid-binding protein
LAAFLGARVLLQHLLGTPPDQAAAATDLLARDEVLLLSDAAFAEVMTSLEHLDEGIEPQRLGEIGRAIVGHPTVAVVDEVVLLRALELVEVQHDRFLDAYTKAIAERSGVRAVVLDGDQIEQLTA